MEVPARFYPSVKRMVDVAAAALLVALLVPVLLVIAIVVKLDSRGPILFRQIRIGKDGKPFTVLKFRSMAHDADPGVHEQYAAACITENLAPPEDGGSLKMVNDLRTSRSGRILRRFSIDELPQLINVLRGEMSLVGPRPHLPYEVELYQEWHKRRLEVLPGITGWWQIKGRNQVSFDDLVRMDLYYIDHMSLWLDLKIILLTPWEALVGRGAG